MDYDKEYFLAYVFRVCEEMNNRDIKYQDKYLIELEKFCNYSEVRDINYPEHNNRYFMQCYYNLQEKFDREIISKGDFKKIKNVII